jgi:colicin import membrane protein
VVMQQVAPKPTPTPPPPPPVEAAPPPPPPEPVKAPEPPKPVEPPKAAEVPPAEDKQALEEMLAAEDSKAKAEAEAAAAKAAKQKADAEAKAAAAAKAAAIKAAAVAKAAAAAKAAATAAAEAEKKRVADLAKQPPKDFAKSMASVIEGAKQPDLLDKTPIKKAGAPPVGSPSATPTQVKGPNAGSPTGTDSVNQAREQDLLKSQITAALRECWNKPSAGGGVSAPAVTIKWTLANNGMLTGEPKVMQSDRNSPLADQAERAAIRAVQACSPFKLKPELYNIWREITWVFDPNKAL